MASASDHRAHAALQPADCLILLPQRLPAAVETSIGPAHYPAECTQSDAFLQPSLRARKGRANSNSFSMTGMPGRSGRKTFVPTPEQRKKVKTLAGSGMPQEQICQLVINPQTDKPLDEKSLRKH